MKMAQNLYKWPRTWHLPFSPGLQNDDRRIPDMSVFHGKRIIVTEKYDGEGATMTREISYPRSPDGRYHPSRDRMKAYHAERAGSIPEGWRVSGEYMYARHSVPYTRANGNPLASLFMGFGVWDENNVLLSWDETLDIFEMLNVTPARILYDGIFDENKLHQIADALDPEREEGFVVRVAEAIPYPDGDGDAGRFFPAIAKWVRKGHVQTDEHWSFRWRDAPDYVNELV